MSRLALEQFKTGSKDTSNVRLTLDQFKSQTSNNLNNEDLEKLTGGILGACHVKPVDFDPDFGSNPPIKSGQDR